MSAGPDKTGVAKATFFLLVVWVWLFAAIGAEQALGQARTAIPVRAAADAVLQAFKARNGERLASLVHPAKGVRFSPNAFVTPAEDVVLSRDQIAAFWRDPKTYLWGYAEGTGNPIRLTPRAYAERFVLDHDYAKASAVSVNDDRASGTTQNNAAQVYPAATRVEYYIAPTQQGGLDWAALRLVLEPVQGSWRLVGVIHDAWSP